MQARTVINDCYIVRDKLGEDGFCELWRATSVFNATEFLLRFFKPLPGLEEAMERFRKAFQASNSVSHAAVAAVIELERFEGRYFVVSSYAGHKSLRSLLEEGVSFGLEQLCRYILELGQGLDAFHNIGITYGCFNSENALFLIRQGRVESVQVQKPGYWSLLSLLKPDSVDDWRESWAYVAPEIKSGNKIAPDIRADVYSLGIHLFRFLTGKLPFPDEGDFVRKEAASLTHVAKALLRRGVPEALVRIALRALRPDPTRRYPDLVRFLAELRDFTDERRAQWLKNSGVDPLANIETLNRSGGKIGASQIVRSLDTADYFRLLSETPVESAPTRQQRQFPFLSFSDPTAVANLEKGESATKDPGDRAEDSYISEARKTVTKEPWAMAEELPVGEVAEDQKAEEVPPAEEPPEPEAAPMPEGIVVEAPRPRKRPETDTVGIAWKGSRFPQAGLVAALEEALARCRHGRGTFRFVEEPWGPAAAALGRAIARFRDEAIVLDLKAFPPNADTTDLLRMLRAPLARAMMAEDRRTTNLLGARLMECGGEALFGAEPLGSVLYGFDRPEPDPEFLDSDDGIKLLARSILGFGRRTKPLMIFCRGGEQVSEPVHRVLLEMAALSPFAPLSCVVFFGRERSVPAWHILARLAT